MTDKDLRQAEYFGNRVQKNEKNLRRWARREGVQAFRLYDRDIPEVPLALDLYRAEEGDALCMALYERPYDKAEELEAEWLGLMATRAAEVLGIPPESVFCKTRRRQRGDSGGGQYERLGSGKAERIVAEQGLRFIVNLSDYLDTGLFLDHRPLRALVRSESAGRSVLNLFCYTGSISVHAAAGGAREVDSVDLSNTYLDWAGRNLALNGFGGEAYRLHRADVPSWLRRAAEAGRSWDLIVADPPTFSNSKSAPGDFDVNRDWPALLGACRSLLAPGGILYFSSNSRKLAWDPALAGGPGWVELGQASIPPDFRDPHIHRAWRWSAPESSRLPVPGNGPIMIV